MQCRKCIKEEMLKKYIENQRVKEAAVDVKGI